ncbi:hypothetical protein RHMOL_Rhmol01G0158700 [Rhododendron molle]|uniref:Uncharacterized protein n=1 Tax=Rhododendron molle TaxID=49168 RepID=A0ACC0Q1M5_RHOML|nr:hypothetical protein RHMOL_Rhmol01G0158700 [Rhododendron molle]
MPTDFAAITGLRVGGEPIQDPAALEWFLGGVPQIEEGMINWDPWKVAGLGPEYLARSTAVTASRVLLESAFGWQ